MKVYTGFRIQGDPKHPGGWATVTVGKGGPGFEGSEPPQFHADRIHPDGGLEWVGNVSGQLRLAWDLIADALGVTHSLPANVYGEFVERVIYGLPEQEWHLTEEEIRKTVGEIQMVLAIAEHDEGAVDAHA